MRMILDCLPIHCRPVKVDSGVASTYLLTGDSWAASLCALIDDAQHSILMAMYSISGYWSVKKYPKNNVYGSLIAAAERGINCRCVLACHKKTATTSNFNLWSGDRLRDAGWVVRDFRSSRLLHAKLIIIDGVFLAIGSHNIALSSSAINTDLSLGITDQATVDAARDFFERVYSEAVVRKENKWQK